MVEDIKIGSPERNGCLACIVHSENVVYLGTGDPGHWNGGITFEQGCEYVEGHCEELLDHEYLHDVLTKIGEFRASDAIDKIDTVVVNVDYDISNVTVFDGSMKLTKHVGRIARLKGWLRLWKHNYMRINC
jgi:hypothetical protein